MGGHAPAANLGTALNPVDTALQAGALPSPPPRQGLDRPDAWPPSLGKCQRSCSPPFSSPPSKPPDAPEPAKDQPLHLNSLTLKN